MKILGNERGLDTEKVLRLSVLLSKERSTVLPEVK